MIMNELDELNELFDDLDVDNDVTPKPELEQDDNFLDDFKEVRENKGTNVLDDILLSNGLDVNNVPIINENGEEVSVNFYSLSKEEQIDILNEINSEEVIENFEGVDLVEYLYQNNMTLGQFLDNYKNTILSDIQINEIDNYEIDAYSDEELFLLDLKNKFDLTDEELVRELEKELQDEEVFKKKVNTLRQEYKDLEDQYQESQRAEFEKNQQQEYAEFEQQMINVARNIPEFYGIELEDDDKNEVLSFLLDLDENGVSDFYKTLNNPNKLYEAAWFLKYGKESFDLLVDSYEAEIAKIKKDKTSTVIKKENDNGRKVTNIHELYNLD